LVLSRSAALKLSLAVLALAAPAVSQAAPYSPSEIAAVQTDDEAKVREIRTQEVTQLRIALGRRLPQNRRADLYFRLAEIYLEAYRMEFLLEGRAHEKRIERGVPDKFIDRGRSKPYLGMGIKACQDILRLGIAYPKMDEVYYFLGFNFGELGREKESLQYFTALTQRYPNSPYVVEAYRELGDGAFGKTQYRKAQGYYESAVRRNLGDSLPRVLHKLAWTYYRLKMYDRAVSTMREAVNRASKSDEKFLSLREEALRDMAIFMTEAGRVDEALAYFDSVAGDRDFYPRLLERLGKQYERNVEPAKAIQVYESLLRTHPEDEAAFRVRAKLVDLDLRRGKYRDALSRLKGMKFFSEGDVDTQTAAQNLRAMVRRTATEHHEAFRKNGNRGALAISEEFYSAYLNTILVQDDPRKETPEIQMYLADVKREIGKSKEASELYRKVLDSGDKRYAKEAGTLWTASLSDAIKKASAGGARNSSEPSALEREFVEAADDMSSALGDAPEGREAALRAAQVLAGYRSTQKEAAGRIEKIVKRWPSTTQALTAARLWIQMLSDRLPQGNAAKVADSDAGEDLLDAIKELRSNDELMAADQKLGQGKLRLTMTELDARLRVGTIAAQERDQDFDAAAKGYEEFARTATSRELAEKAYANAVGAYGKAGDAEAVDRVVQAWLKRYPDGKRPIEVVRSAATSALIQGRFSQAAALFERLGSRGTDPESLETAARLYEGDGSTSKSRAVRDQYLDLYKRSPRRFNVALDVARDLDRQGQDSSAATFYKYCMAGPVQFEAECGARLGDLFLKGSDEDNARQMYRRVAALKAGKGSPFVSYARYRLADLMEQGTRFEKLSLPDTQLKRGLQQRLEFLEPLSRAYTASVESGGPWAIASLDRLASWALRFAADVDQIQPPSNATPANVAAFRKGLSEVSGPLRKKAYETWTDAYRKAIASEILSPAVPGIADRLAEARRPGAPGRAQGPRGRFRLAGLPADGGNDGADRALEKVRDKLTKSAQDAQAWVDYGNLLWGSGKPGLARIAYDRALELNRRNPAALNNRGVILASAGEEDWLAAAESAELFVEALRQDEFFIAAKMNRAALLNYYRLFAKAKPLWEQALLRAPTADAHDGVAVATQGMGNARAAAASFAKASDLGADSGRFVRAYHEAARAENHDKCLSALDDVSESKLAGFEKDAVESLKRFCKEGKK
jgi:tetratricopeptide (TPR) repeat protein